MEPISAAIVPMIGKTLVTACANRVIDVATVSGKKKLVSILAKLKVDSIASNYYDKVISRVITFKTLNGEGRDVKLNEVYYPLKLKRLNDEVNIQVKDGTTLKYDGCICITGSAGQGKTTIMRKMFIEELILGERFPFFLTLRDVDFSGEKNCVQLLHEHLNYFGLDCSFDEAKALVSSGRAVIFLDGFDEIKNEQRLNAVKAIEGLHLVYSCPSVITTRPDTELLNLTGLESYLVQKLERKEIEGLIKKIVHNNEYAKAIINTLKENSFLHNAINTPILVSVFVLTYDSFNDEPRNITDFYDAVFISLIFKHDKSKNFKRVRLSGLSNHVLEHCFSIFSYLSLADNVSTFNDVTIRKYFLDASAVLEKNDISDELMYDIINGTNLIVMDGHNRYVYIHRSIQEYFAAKCISGFDEDGKKQYYTVSSEWLENLISNRQVLKMLSSIDSKYFSKFYVLPLLAREGLITENDNVGKCSPEDFKEYVLNAELGFIEDKGRYHFRMLRTQMSYISPRAEAIENVFSLITYQDYYFSQDVHEYIRRHIEVLTVDFIRHNNLTEKDFIERYASPNTVIDVGFDDDVEWNVFIKLQDFTEPNGIPQPILDNLAAKVNKWGGVVNKYMHDNHFTHQKSTNFMIKMLGSKKYK